MNIQILSKKNRKALEQMAVKETKTDLRVAIKTRLQLDDLSIAVKRIDDKLKELGIFEV